jgi:hypothetical protein
VTLIYDIDVKNKMVHVVLIALLGVIFATTQALTAFTQSVPLKGTMTHCSCCFVPSAEAISCCSSKEAKETSRPCASKNEGECGAYIGCCKAHPDVFSIIRFANFFMPDGERFQSTHFIGLIRSKSPELPPPRLLGVN